MAAIQARLSFDTTAHTAVPVVLLLGPAPDSGTQQLLELLGYRVAAATTELEAPHRPPDLILLTRDGDAMRRVAGRLQGRLGWERVPVVSLDGEERPVAPAASAYALNRRLRHALGGRCL
ncbi:MAG: hypothetical protein ACK47B_26805 [Armatimonadota bacterium]